MFAIGWLGESGEWLTVPGSAYDDKHARYASLAEAEAAAQDWRESAIVPRVADVVARQVERVGSPYDSGAYYRVIGCECSGAGCVWC